MNTAFTKISGCVDKLTRFVELYHTNLVSNWHDHTIISQPDPGTIETPDEPTTPTEWPILNHEPVDWTHYHVEESNTNYAVGFMHSGTPMDVVAAYEDDPTGDVFSSTLTGEMPRTMVDGTTYNNRTCVQWAQHHFDDAAYLTKRQSTDVNEWPDGWIPFSGGKVFNAALDTYVVLATSANLLRQERFIGLTPPGCPSPITTFSGLSTTLQDGQLHASVVINPDNEEYLIQNPRTKQWQNIYPAFRYGSNDYGDNIYGPLWGLMYAGDTLVLQDNASRYIYQMPEPSLIVFPSADQYGQVYDGVLIYPFSRIHDDLSYVDSTPMVMFINTTKGLVTKKNYALSPYTKYYEGHSYTAHVSNYPIKLAVVRATITGETVSAHQATRGQDKPINTFN